MEKEKRTFNIEFRASEDDGGRTIEGYAALYDSESEELWGFTETIEPGAFDNADLSDVRALMNHDPNLILARSASGTMQLGTDQKGLWYRFEAPDTTFGNDFLTMVKRGDISQSSFAFTIKEDSWEDLEGGNTLRHIRQIDKVFDVSPVTYPAYEKTSVTARSLDAYQKEKEKSEYISDEDMKTLRAKLSFNLSAEF